MTKKKKTPKKKAPKRLVPKAKTKAPAAKKAPTKKTAKKKPPAPKRTAASKFGVVCSLATSLIDESRDAVRTALTKRPQGLPDIVTALGGDPTQAAVQVRVRRLLNDLIQAGECVRMGTARWTTYQRA